MESEEPKLQFSPSGAPIQPRLVKDMPSGSPVYDDAEDWASCVTESILYDTQDAISWNNQVIDINFPSLFQNVNGFDMDSQMDMQPK